MGGATPSAVPIHTATPLDRRQQDLLAVVAAAERAAALELPSDDAMDPKRRFRVEATRPEMNAQPAAIRHTLSANDARLDQVAARLAARFSRVYLVGAGDSLAVMMAARTALEAMLGVPCEPVQSLEFASYIGSLAGPGCAVLALSSSGETTRTVAAALVAQQQQAYTVALTNTPGSTLDREADISLHLQATRVGWPTQSSTTALALLLDIAVRTGQRQGLDVGSWRAALGGLPDLMGQTLGQLDAPVARIAQREVGAPMVLFCGGGPSQAAAVVGAAKVKECTPGHALAIQVEEYHHYNSQKAGEPLVLLAPAGPTLTRAVDTAREALRWGGRVYAITTNGETAFDDVAEDVLRLPVVPEPLSPLLTFLPAQLVGYHLGMAGFAAAERATSPAAEKHSRA